MKVLLIGNYVRDRQESMQRFCSLLERGLTEAGYDVLVSRPSVTTGRLCLPESSIAKWFGYVDKLLVYRGLLRSAVEKADIVHICDHANAFYVHHALSRPHIVTCHDLIAVRAALGEIPTSPTRWSGKRLQGMILRGIMRSQHVACVSESTRSDVLRLTLLPEDRVTKVYNGLNYEYAPMARERAAKFLSAVGVDPGMPFVLHIGSNAWYKNRTGVLSIFAALRQRPDRVTAKLVMVGPDWTEEMEALATALAIGNEVIRIKNADNDCLTALYSTARVLLFPSLHEGFGWPIVEAQACGCTVVTSNRAPMTDVGGSVSLYVDPEDVSAASHCVNTVLMRKTPDDEARQANIANAGRFSAANMIRNYARLYEKLVADHRRATDSLEARVSPSLRNIA